MKNSKLNLAKKTISSLLNTNTSKHIKDENVTHITSFL